MSRDPSALQGLPWTRRGFSPAWRAGAALVAMLLTACGGGRTPLVVYSPHGNVLLGMVERQFEAAHPDVDVRWLDMGSQEVLDRLRAERANPQADVWFGGPSTIFSRGARDSLLEPYHPSWAAATDRSGWGPDSLYFAVYETPAVIIYAREAVSAEQAPRDWDDLLDPRWRGKVLIRDPLASGTMRAIFGMVIERELRRTADTAAGFAWLRRLDANTREYVLNGPILNNKLVRQEGLVSAWDLPDVLLNIRDGLQLAYVFPSSGSPVIADAIGVVRGARHRELARAFVEFVGTVESQVAAAREAMRLPARRDLPAAQIPDWVAETRARMRRADVDWAMLDLRGAEWMQYWDRNVRGQGAE